MKTKEIRELHNFVYEININPDPYVLCEALLNLRHALLKTLWHLEGEHEDNKAEK